MQKEIEDGIYTNAKYSLYERFKSILERPEHKDFYLYAVSGYFRASAYFKLRDSLAKAKGLKVLVGINADSLSAGWYRESKERREGRIREQAYSELCAEIESAKYDQRVEEGLKQFVADVLDGRLEMRAYPEKIVHAKFYLFLPEGWSPESALGTLITGSSNFTAPGLGTDADYNKANYELNVELRGARQLSFVKSEFDALWGVGVELIPSEIAERFRTKTFLRKDVSPRELYLRFLYETLKDNIEYDARRVEFDFPLGYKRLNYQIDAVNEGLSFLERHNGFILADVVGLGKTIVATLIMRSFLVTQDRRSKVLVVAPPAVLPNWKSTLDDFGINPIHYTLVSSGNLKKISEPDLYSLMVVDEAHAFRNAATDKYLQLDRIAKARGTFGRRKVVLVSATPLNNSPRELLNLLSLFQDNRNSSLGAGDLVKYFGEKQREYDAVKREGVSVAEALERMKLVYKDIRERVLQDVVIRRTRSDLEENAVYKKDLDSQGIRFPKIQKPRVLQYYLDSDQDDLYEKTIVALTSGLHYAYHRHISYLRGEKAKRFNISDNTFSQLSDLMKRFFLKRLDSSFFAFRSSLGRFRDATRAFISMMESGRIFISASVDVVAFVNDEDVDGLVEQLGLSKESDPAITECQARDFRDEFMDDLRSDLATLDGLLRGWNANAEDPKLQRFLKEIDDLLRRDRNPGGKLVVFSESEDTINYLAAALEKAGRDDCLVISARNRDEMEEDIRANFDANYRGEKRDRYRVVVCTDVLAEGVNLHRANTIVNYDTPWNSVRLFQRIGRVNRVGSTADKVFVYNFFPVSYVEDHIELDKKARMKLQAFHSAFGEDSPIYSSDEEVGHFSLFNPEDVLAEGGTNARLEGLMEIRAVKENESELFARVTELPAKARCSRAAGSDGAFDFVFLRSPRRDSYYSVRDGKCQALSFTESARLLRAGAEEKPVAGERTGQAAVDAAMKAFNAEEELDALDRTGAKSRSGGEAAAMAYLQSFLDGFDELGVTDGAREAIRKSLNSIKRGAASKGLIKLIRDIHKNAVAGNVNFQAQAAHLAEVLPERARDGGGAETEDKTFGQTLLELEPPSFVLGEWFIEKE